MPNKKRDRPLRGERRSRPLPVAPLFALAILAVGITYAQQNLPAPTTAPTKVPAASQPPAAEVVPTTAQDAAAAPAAAAAAATEDAPQAAKPASAPAAAKGSPQRFEPTEKVRPDFDVAFPVDI
jgi:hypothetical protein